MPRPALRSRRNIRRTQIRTPTRVVVHYARKKPGKAHCSHCGAELPGIPHVAAYKFRRMPKTCKRPERPYGGVLCSACMRRQLITQSRTLHVVKA